MNYKMRVLMHTLVTVILFIGCMTSIIMAQENIIFEDIVVLTVPHGQGLGKVFINCGSGGCDVPRCFYIDPNGIFYVPEIKVERPNSRGILIKKFSSDGTPIEVINVEGIADVVREMTLGVNGDIYLVVNVCGNAESYIGHYDKNGKLINRFGRKGEITKDQFNKITYGDPGKGFRRDKCFAGPCQIFIGKNDEIFIAKTTRYRIKEGAFDVCRYNTKSAALLEIRKDCSENNLPEEVRSYRSKYFAKLSLKDKITNKEAQRKMGGVYSIIAPDGEYYYMRTYLQAPTRMEIRKVVFENDKPE